jgi:hypothetical protein
MVFVYVLAFYWALMLAWVTYFAVITAVSARAAACRDAQDPTQSVACGGGGGGGGDGGGDGATTTAAGGHVDNSAGCSLPRAARSAAASDSGGESNDEDVVCATSSVRDDAGGGAIYTFVHEGQTAPTASGEGSSDAGAGADGLCQRKGVAARGVAE